MDFLVLKNVLNMNRVNYAKELINNKVNYFRLKDFLDNDMINTVNNVLNLNIDYTKYRVSNNNNSSDAASFHRDLQSYTNESPEVFTVLAYLDKSHMELVPNTHQNISIPVYNMKSFLNKRTTVEMNPGDILIFYATLVHRGIFYDTNNDNRRLIQLFDCIDINQMEQLRNQILHIPCKNNFSSLVNNINITLNKNFLISELINFISTIITFKGYGYPYYGLSLITDDKEIKYLSTEANKKRLYNPESQDSFLEINNYIMNINRYKDINSKKRNIYQFVSFGITSTLFFIFIILFIIVLIRMYKVLKNIKKQKNNLI